jgi:NNP family nitrate/nitrite transporter-like MFS transporter
MTVALTAVLGLVGWRIWREDVISDAGLVAVTVVVVALLIAQEVAVFRVNRPARAGTYPAEDHYPFRNVAALCIAYFATFGSELAVVTVLPAFFADTWGLGPAAAGAAASGFAFMNLVARPGGGLLSDLLGSRKRTLSALCAGLVAGYLVMAAMGPAWPWVLAVAACMFCSFFVQAGEGAVYAIVPLVKKRVSGQISGMAGAYGNIGALVFLTVGILSSTRVLFLVMAAGAVVALVASRMVVEPEHSFAEDLQTDEPVVVVERASAPVPAAAAVATPALAD